MRRLETDIGRRMRNAARGYWLAVLLVIVLALCAGTLFASLAIAGVLAGVFGRPPVP